MTGTINLAEKLATFSDHRSPRTIAKFNSCNGRNDAEMAPDRIISGKIFSRT
jgi:hypothetical protein